MNTIRLISSAVRPGPVHSNEHHANEHNVVRLHPSSARTSLTCVLACRWQQEPDGRLTCVWQREPIDGSPNRHLCLVAG